MNEEKKQKGRKDKKQIRIRRRNVEHKEEQTMNEERIYIYIRENEEQRYEEEWIRRTWRIQLNKMISEKNEK